MTMPLNVLEKSINQKISVLLKDGRTLEGKLSGFDEYMNIILDDSEETVEDKVRRLGTIVLRGNNVIRIAPKP
ncbi:MAG: LSM domain-containing protein [Thermoplasmata archaeon]